MDRPGQLPPDLGLGGRAGRSGTRSSWPLGCLIVVNLLGLALALGLNRTVKTRHLLRSLFFLPVVLSPLASAYIWEYIFDYQGALNRLLGAVGLTRGSAPGSAIPHWALWTVFVVMVWQHTGLAMVIFLAGLQGIPQELDEAGASTAPRPGSASGGSPCRCSRPRSRSAPP